MMRAGIRIVKSIASVLALALVPVESAAQTDPGRAVEMYLVAHHGGADASDPALFNALKPRVAILVSRIGDW